MTALHADAAKSIGAGVAFVEALEIAVEAYTYAYPLILMEATRRLATNVEFPDFEHGSGAPPNQFTHLRSLPDATSIAAQRPNLDTLYSALWFDVENEPLIVTIPEARERFYALSLLDHWSEVFASPGTRTTGRDAQAFAIIGPSWNGALPQHLRIYRSPTALGWIVGITQLNGPTDLAAVARFQAGLSASPWSSWGQLPRRSRHSVNEAAPLSDPVDVVASLSSSEFFSQFAQLTRQNPPHAQDYPVLDRIRRIGITLGGRLDLRAISAEARLALEKAPRIAQLGFQAAYEQSLRFVNHWHAIQRPLGVYGTDYRLRAGVALTGLGAHGSEDVVCFGVSRDAAGEPLDSSRCYRVAFPQGQLPPVKAFWSLTLYDQQRRFADNALNRHALRFGAGQAPLPTASDGSTTLYVQRESPGPTREANWLPAPHSGPFSLSLRLYWPRASAITGAWFPPPVRPAEASARSAPN